MKLQRFKAAAGQAAIAFLICAGVLIGVLRLVSWIVLGSAESGSVSRFVTGAAYVIAAGAALARFWMVYRAPEKKDP